MLKTNILIFGSYIIYELNVTNIFITPGICDIKNKFLWSSQCIYVNYAGCNIGDMDGMIGDISTRRNVIIYCTILSLFYHGK